MHRPRIGLVLAGGGAKGGAHFGVLKVLEELHVPVDCIALDQDCAGFENGEVTVAVVNERRNPAIGVDGEEGSCVLLLLAEVQHVELLRQREFFERNGRFVSIRRCR